MIYMIRWSMLGQAIFGFRNVSMTEDLDILTTEYVFFSNL